jgi:hypothetical protein
LRPLTALHQLAQIAGQQRRQRGIDLGCAGALELAEGTHHLMGEGDVDIGELGGDRFRQRAFVGGMAIGME